MTADRDLIETLSEREMDVLRLLAEGKTNPEIGEALGIRFQTAKWYVSEVLQKLQVPSREAAAAEYRRYNLAPARMRRALAEVPLFAKWGAAGAAVLAAAAVLFLAFGPDLQGDAEPQWLIAWVNSDIRDENPEPEPIHIIDAKTGETWDLGEPDLWGGVAWSPAGDRLLAMRRPNELVLLSYPEGDVLDFQAPDLSDYTVCANHTDPESETYASLADAHWSPGGTRFFVAGCTFDKNGHLLWQRDVFAASVVWSPSGDWIAVGNEAEVVIFTAEGIEAYRHEDVPSESMGFSQWISETVVALPMAGPAFDDGWLGYARLDLSADQPVPGICQSAATLLPPPLEVGSEDYVFARELIEVEIEAAGEDSGPVPRGVTDGTAVTTIGSLAQANLPPRPIDILVADAESVFRSTIHVTWTFQSTQGPWGSRISFVIRD